MIKQLRNSILAAALGLPAVVQAGGLYMYEIGTSDLGFAGAGTAARAEDASTVYGNPAGMTRLAGNQYVVAGQMLYGKFDYDVNPQSLAQQNFGGGSPGNVIGWMPGGSFFYSHSINDRLKLGMGVYGNFGLAMDFGDSWAGRNLVDKTALMALTLQPSIAYKVSDQVSVGAGLTANYGFFKLERTRLLPPNDTVDQDDSDWQYGARLGIMVEPSSSTRLGLVWTSKVEYDFDINATVTGLLGRTHIFPLSASVNAPQQVMGSFYQKLNDRWVLTGNLGWQDWSQFSQNSVELNGTTTTSKLDLQDTWHVAIGGQYQYSAKTRINGGIAYDTGMYKSDNRISFAMPTSPAWRFGLGAQYTLSPQSELGVAAEYLRGNTTRDPSTLIGGEYQDPYMVFLAVHYSNRF